MELLCSTSVAIRVSATTIRVVTAGWGLPKESRTHRESTYERWAGGVPDGFASSVKIPKEITHVRKLAACEQPLRRFIDETAAPGPKRALMLVQLPPKFAFDHEVASDFFWLLPIRPPLRALRSRVEVRHSRTFDCTARLGCTTRHIPSIA